jgi:DNA repair photolyase
MSEYYHIDNYQTHIRIKENAPKILRKELKKLGYTRKKTLTLLEFTDELIPEKRKPIIGVSGGVSDSYQKIERDLKLTRKVLQVLLEYQLPVFLLTKSDLVLRDLDILQEINEQAFSNVCFSIAFHDDDTRKKLEPKSSSIDERFEALKEIRNVGIHGGVMAMPIIPYISDTYENLMQLAKRAKDVKSEFIIFAGLTIKPGRQKNYFLNDIQKKFPEAYKHIKELYWNNNKFGHPIFNKIPLDVIALSPHICDKIGIKWLSIRHGCSDEFDSNLIVLKRILEILFIMSSLLRKPRNQWMKYHDLAVQLEYGLPELKTLIDSNDLDKFQTVKYFVNEIEEILEKGTSKTLNSLKIEAKEKSEALAAQIL